MFLEPQKYFFCADVQLSAPSSFAFPSFTQHGLLWERYLFSLFQIHISSFGWKSQTIHSVNKKFPSSSADDMLTYVENNSE